MYVMNGKYSAILKKIYDENCHDSTFHLDKDIIFQGNKEYSPQTCVFVPMEINKRTGKYVNVIKRTINDSLFPIVKYLSYSYNELNYDYVKNLNFDVDVNWEQRRYQIVKDLLSNNFDGRKMSIDEVDNAIFTADLIINRLTTI